MVKQPIRAYGPRALDDLRLGFAEDRYDVRRLIVRVVVTSALPARQGAATERVVGDPQATSPDHR